MTTSTALDLEIDRIDFRTERWSMEEHLVGMLYGRCASEGASITVGVALTEEEVTQLLTVLVSILNRMGLFPPLTVQPIMMFEGT